MAKFESGVARYIIGTATIRNHFPVDFRGNEDVCCEQCRYYQRYRRSCNLNDAICEYPSKSRGSQCPLTFEEDE